MGVTNFGQWAMYAWAGAVALAAIAGAWAAIARREIRPVLPLEHVAAAALVATFGWEMFVYLPGSIMGFWSLTAGLGDVGGDEAHQAFVVAQAVFVVACAAAVVGILRRRTWGIVLGIGLSAALVLWTAVNTVHLLVQFGPTVGSDVYINIVTTTVGLGVVPALVAIGLMTWPLLRGTTLRPAGAGSERDPDVSSAPEAAR